MKYKEKEKNLYRYPYYNVHHSTKIWLREEYLICEISSSNNSCRCATYLVYFVYLLEGMRKERRRKKKNKKKESTYTGSITAKKSQTCIISWSIRLTLLTKQNYTTMTTNTLITIIAVFAMIIMVNSTSIPANVTCSFLLTSYQ